MPSNYKTVINFRDGIQVDTDDLISNNGLVGIGSTIPRQQLDVRGNIIVDENTYLNNLKVTGVTTYYNTLNVGSGNSVGIGTTVPEEAFQVGVGTTGATISLGGTVIAQKFVGDGSELTGIPASVWVNPGVGQTIYSTKDVGIGTTATRGQADFGVGYEIYMDAKSGVGTFEGIVVKNITVENDTGAGQGNVNADVGTFSTITATSSITAPTFIGTVTNATRSVVSAGLTDSPDIDINYITGVGGTFTGITSFTTLQVTGGIVANGGIITATTFSGTATTATHAATAYALGGDPDIQVDKLTTTGLAPSIIKGSGVSTIGQDLLVGEFIGVGATNSAIGDAAGFIGTVRIHDGDLKLGGSISIGGSLVGTVDLGGTQNINVLNIGAGLSVAGVSTLSGNITGGGDFNISGSMVAGTIQSTDSIIAGGGITCIGQINSSAGAAFTGGGIIVGGGGTFGGPLRVDGFGVIGTSGCVIGGGITVGGEVSGVTNVLATGVGTFGTKVVGGDGQFVNVVHSGITTIATGIVSDFTVNGNFNVAGIGTVQTGVVVFDGVSGIASASAMYAIGGISTFANVQVTNGNDTRIFGKYIGVNTTSPRISEGLEMYEQSSEIFVYGNSSIGIGSTSGGRGKQVKLYVGYGRSELGNSLIPSQSIFEGNIGIGTTICRLSNGYEYNEIYKNTIFFNNHLGVGGTVGGGTTTCIRIGINTATPECSLDMKYAGEPLLLPHAFVGSGGNNDNPAVLNIQKGDAEGCLWYDNIDDKIRTKGSDGVNVAIATELGYAATPAERGFTGNAWQTEAQRNNDSDFVPELSPPSEGQLPAVGWGTANYGYNLTSEQFQYYGSDNIWRSIVGSAQTGVSLIIEGTTAKLMVAGIGSISLGTLS